MGYARPVSETVDPRVQIPALRRVSAVDAAVAALREQILHGRLPPGLALREGDLSDRMGISRHTTRVALSALAHDGLVRHEPNRGAFVRRMTVAEAVDCYRLRALLELEAARASCGDVAALAPVRAAARRMADAPEDWSWETKRETDLELHRALVETLGSPMITRTFDSMATELRLCFLIEGMPQREVGELARDHLALVEALESGDTDRATATLSDHLNASRDDVVTALRDGGRPVPIG